MKRLLQLGLAAALWLPSDATTLRKLSLDDMILKSTVIVHCTVGESYSAFRGSTIYTHYKISVRETWKGSVSGPIDLAIPGGLANGMRETYAGAPALAQGGEYVLFLWTSKSGLTQVIGLSQGLFNVTTNAAGVSTVSRPAATEMMLDGNGLPVTDSDFEMSLAELRARVMATLRGQADQ